MATFSLVYNILHTTPRSIISAEVCTGWDGKLAGVVSLFRAHIVPLLLLLVAVVARRRETLPGPADDFR